jgi:hypothetical protein
MGWLGNLLGSADGDIIQNGLLGRGEVLGVDASGMTMQIGNGLVERKCTITLNVMLDGQQPYQAQVSQRIQEVYLPQLSSGGAIVAVKVDPADHSRVAIDFDTPVPEVTLPASEGQNSAAWILEHGKPITVVLVANAPIGVKNAKGDPVQALTLTVATGVPEPYQIQVGNAVPASALPLVFPGSKLHAKLGDGPNDVVVDWGAGAVKE